MRPLNRPIAEGWGLLLPLGVLALLLRRRRRVALALAVLAAAVAAALRDPDRLPPAGNEAYAPADGRVVEVADDANGLTIAVFLALWNVHVQRAPLAGRVTRLIRGGKGFRPALFGSAAENVQLAIHMDTGWGPVVVTLIAGLIARRIVPWVGEGEELTAGDRIGMIKFGSRVTLRLPAGSVPLVRVGQEIRAGVTPVARRP